MAKAEIKRRLFRVPLDFVVKWGCRFYFLPGVDVGFYGPMLYDCIVYYSWNFGLFSLEWTRTCEDKDFI